MARRRHKAPGRFVQHRDPWREAAAAVRRSECSPAAKLLSDAIEYEHRQNPKFPLIRKGHGGRLDWQDQHGHQHHCRPGWAEAVGMSRRSMIRARYELEQTGKWGVRPGGGRQTKYVGHGVTKEIGNGGRKPGGDGLANEWYPLVGAAELDAEQLPDQPEAPAGDRRPLRDYWDEQHTARGP